MKKVLTVGEATLDNFLFIDDANVHCSIDKENCEFCIKYADKVIATDMKMTVGGNAANTAVSFSRLGFEAAIYAVIGDDWIGERVQKALKDEKVSDEYLVIEPGPTSYATALVFQGERNLVIYHVPRQYRPPKFAPVDWVYLTNLSTNYQDAYRRVIEFAQSCGAKISFNPGTHQLKDGVEILKPYLKATEILFVNKQEAMVLTKLPGSTSFRKLSETLYDLGPRIIVITDGPTGSYAFDGDQLLNCAIFPAKIVERTGTGDSFAAAFTAAILNGQPVEEAMRWGTANSASKIEQVGPQAGLLTAEGMTAMLKKNKDIRPTVVKD